jgi:hypothetical protein
MSHVQRKQKDKTMINREAQTENNIFFVCSLIEYIARATKNTRKNVVNQLGREEIAHYFELADVYHCENIDKLTAELTSKHHIETGIFNNEASCRYTPPSYFDIAKVYKRLIVSIMQYKSISFTDALIEVYNSWITEKIDDYNSSMYYESPDYVFQSYIAGEVLRD